MDKFPIDQIINAGRRNMVIMEDFNSPDQFSQLSKSSVLALLFHFQKGEREEGLIFLRLI